MKRFFKNFSKICLRQILPGTLIFLQLFTPTVLQPLLRSAAYAESPSKSAGIAETIQPSEASLQALRKLDQADPLIELLGHASLDSALGPMPDWSVDEENSLRDQDPFFLRSQHWARSQTDSNDSLALKVGDQKLLLNLALENVFENRDWIVLASKKADGIFSGRDGQGLFLVDREELVVSSTTHQPVPLYFFPLPGNAWNQEVLAFEEPAANGNAIYVSDADGEVLPINTADFDTAVKAERLNLMLAVAETVINSAAENSRLSLADMLPRAGSTMGFGTYYDPSQIKDLVAQRSAVPGPSAFSLQSVLNKVSAFVFGAEAWAQQNNGTLASTTPTPPLPDSNVAADNSRLIHNLVRMGTIVSLTFVAAIVLKYTVLRKHFQLKHEKDPATVNRLRREITDIGDVFAHNLNVFSSFASVWFSNSVEFMLDRFFPKLGAGENGIVRKLLNKTLFYRRNVNDRVPVSGKTWLFGSVILGGIDTFCVYLQLYYVVPGMARYIAQHLPSLREPVEKAWDPNNVDTEAINRNETIRNASQYMTAGAASFGRDLQDQNLILIQKDVREEFLRKGLNPDEPVNQSAYKDRVDELLNQKNKQMGLPDKSDFLFDAASLYQKSAALLGYGRPADLQPRSAESKDKYWAETRPGLTISVLDKALDRALELRIQFPNNPQLEKAIQILEKSKKKALPLLAYVKAPLSEIWRGRGKLDGLRTHYRDLRRDLVALTVEGATFQNLKRLPLSWVEEGGTEAADLAAVIYRGSFVATMKGLSHSAGRVNDLTATEQEEIRSRLKLELTQKYPEEYKGYLDAGQTPETALSSLALKHSPEFSYKVGEVADVAYAEKIEDAKPYKAQKLDRVGRGQLARARAISTAQFEKQTGRAWDAATAGIDDQKLWREIFGVEFAKGLGLRMEFVSDRMKIRRAAIFEDAESSLQRKVEEAPMRRFLSGLKTSQDQVDFQARLYAEQVISGYLAEVSDVASVSPIDPAQPGFAQKIRQQPAFRKSGMLTRLARAIECVFPNNEYKPGLWSLVKRRVPLVQDAQLSIARLSRGFLDRITAVYAFNWIVWGMNPTMRQLVWGQLLGPTITIPMQVMNRFFANQGWQPMGRKGMMVLYGLLYTWVTFFGQFPQVMGQKAFNEFYTKWGLTVIAGATAMWGASKALEKWKNFTARNQVNTELKKAKADEKQGPPPAPPTPPKTGSQCELPLVPGEKKAS